MIRLIAFATLINAALVVASFYPPAIVTQSGQQGFWPFMLQHPADAATILIAAFNCGLVYVTYRLVNSTDKLWEASIEESMRAHRAKLAIRRIHNPRFLGGEPMAVNFDIINYGVRDAIIIASGSDIYVRPKNPYEIRSFDANFEPTVPPITLKPGEMYAFKSIGAYTLSTEAFAKILADKSDAILIANMQYSDEGGV
jgi:hypothetical protein